jgi:hypothetical protein
VKSEPTIWLSKLAEQFSILVEFHYSTVAISIGNKEFAGAGHSHIRWFAEMFIIGTI